MKYFIIFLSVMGFNALASEPYVRGLEPPSKLAEARDALKDAEKREAETATKQQPAEQQTAEKAKQQPAEQQETEKVAKQQPTEQQTNNEKATKQQEAETATKQQPAEQQTNNETATKPETTAKKPRKAQRQRQNTNRNRNKQTAEQKEKAKPEEKSKSALPTAKERKDIETQRMIKDIKTAWIGQPPNIVDMNSVVNFIVNFRENNSTAQRVPSPFPGTNNQGRTAIVRLVKQHNIVEEITGFLTKPLIEQAIITGNDNIYKQIMTTLEQAGNNIGTDHLIKQKNEEGKTLLEMMMITTENREFFSQEVIRILKQAYSQSSRFPISPKELFHLANTVNNETALQLLSDYNLVNFLQFLKQNGLSSIDYSKERTEYAKERQAWPTLSMKDTSIGRAITEGDKTAFEIALSDLKKELNTSRLPDISQIQAAKWENPLQMMIETKKNKDYFSRAMIEFLTTSIASAISDKTKQQPNFSAQFDRINPLLEIAKQANNDYALFYLRNFKQMITSYQAFFEQAMKAREDTVKAIMVGHNADVEQLKEKHNADIDQLKEKHRGQMKEIEEEKQKARQSYTNRVEELTAEYEQNLTEVQSKARELLQGWRNASHNTRIIPSGLLSAGVGAGSIVLGGELISSKVDSLTLAQLSADISAKIPAQIPYPSLAQLQAFLSSPDHLMGTVAIALGAGLIYKGLKVCKNAFIKNRQINKAQQ